MPMGDMGDSQFIHHAGHAIGAIMHGPSEVPGGDHIVIASDPQGKTFSLVGKRAS